MTCPTTRIHPAIVAQAAATAAALMPGRFFLGVGTGENLNEHILGDRWPRADERREMLSEAVHVSRELWEGELVSFDGAHDTVDRARIYTLPEDDVPIVVAASGREAATLAGEIGNGLVSTAPERELVDAYLHAGAADRAAGSSPSAGRKARPMRGEPPSSGGPTRVSTGRSRRSSPFRATSKRRPPW